MAPTREQLLALKLGDELQSGDMRAFRPHRRLLDRAVPLYELVHFSKHYLEGKLVWALDRSMVRDMLPEPWELAEWELDHMAAEQRAHHRDGTPVRSSDG